MIKYYFPFILLLCLLLLSCSKEIVKEETKPYNKQQQAPAPKTPERKKYRHNDSETTVYICTGNFAKKYHYEEDCKGLENCKGDIEETDLSDAESLGRTPCKLCAADD